MTGYPSGVTGRIRYLTDDGVYLITYNGIYKINTNAPGFMFEGLRIATKRYDFIIGYANSYALIYKASVKSVTNQWTLKIVARYPIVNEPYFELS